MITFGIAAELDPSGEVVNSAASFAAIAAELRERSCAFIGWTDGEGSHHEILFTHGPRQCGRSNHGLFGPNCLFVSVMRVGAFGFDVSSPRAPRAAIYVAEKLFGANQPDETSIALTALLNGVVAALFGYPAP